MVARVQTRGVTTRSKNRFGGEPSSKRALQLESPPLAMHARIYEKLFGHFPPRYPPFRPRKTMEERESFSSLFLPLPPSFIVCHGYRVHYWLFILVEEREGGDWSRLKRSERLNRQIKYYDRQIHGNFVGECSIPALDISLPRSRPEFFLQTISTRPSN